MFYKGTMRQSFSLLLIHFHSASWSSFANKFFWKPGKAVYVRPGFCLKSSASCSVSTKVRMSFVMSTWWAPLGWDMPSSMSVAAIICFRTPMDLLILSAELSFRFGPRPFRKDFRNPFKCSRCKSREMFRPLPPLVFQNLFHMRLCAIYGDNVAFIWTVSRNVLNA